MHSFGRRIGGGCLCGAIRYTLGAYREAVHCHCRDCRRGSGALFQTWVSAPRTRFRWEGDPPPAYRSSSRATRFYCPACGSPLAMAYRGDADISVTLGSLDEPALVDVTANIFADDRIAPAEGFDRRLPDHAAFGPQGEPGGS